MKVLIAEDEEYVRETYARLIKRKGCDVIEAADGITALKLFNEHRPDMILLDFHLPELRGEQVLEEIRKVDFDVKIYVISGSAAKIEKLKSVKAPVNGYLLKPVTVEDIVKIIEENK